MNRRVALVALWAAFAAASVGVGFGAAGLVGGPFSDGVADAVDAAAIIPARDSPGLLTTQTPGSQPSSSPSGRTGRPTDRATTQERATASSGEPTRSGGVGGASSRSESARSVTRSITTRGGLVSATCRSGQVQVSGSPAVGWEIEDIDGGAQQTAKVRFEQPDGASRVEVEAGCSHGVPRFALDDDDDPVGGGSGGGGGGGDDDDDERQGDSGGGEDD